MIIIIKTNLVLIMCR